MVTSSLNRTRRVNVLKGKRKRSRANVAKSGTVCDSFCCAMPGSRYNVAHP